MKKLNLALVRFIQFVVFTVFVFVVITYFGAMLLLPLDIAANLVRLLELIGFNGFIAAFVAIPAVGYLCMVIYKTPGLVQMIIDTGLDLVKTGKAKVDAFNDIAAAVKD